jgi:O-antigen biosynthesis protein
MADIKADIIVLTWNQKSTTRDFVESFFKYTSVPSRLIIIDNGSTDGTREYLTQLKDSATIKLKVILNNENTGFVKGMNQGIEISEAPFVGLVNNDLIFSKGWLEEIISVFDNHPDIGVLNPYSNNVGAYPDAPGKINEFAQSTHEKFKNVFVEMPFCIGFCMFIRRQVIEKIGGLSSEFSPFYFEDTDYSLKAARAGYLVGLAKGAYVWHQGHASLAGLGTKNLEYFTKSKETFRKKWGKTLRVIYQVSNSAEIESVLKDAVRFARKGHYLWFAVKGPKIEPVEIFKKLDIFEHAGIKFINYRSILGLVWRIAFKKKPFDAIVTKNGLLRWFFAKLGYNIFYAFDPEKIDLLKFNLNKIK